MKVDLDYKFGQAIYLKNDDEQIEYLLHRIILSAKGVVLLEIFRPDGEYLEVPESFTTKERNALKAVGVDKGEEGDA